MADYIEKYAEKQSKIYEKQIKEVYGQAAREVKQKMDAFLAGQKAIGARMLEQVKRGEITQADYKKWLSGQVFIGDRWKAKLAEVTSVYMNADKKAREMLGSTTKDVFTESANRTAYEMDKELRGAVSFDLYDKKTVNRLIKDNPKMLPEWKINEKKDYVWNEKRVQNAITQGIIQGESVYDIGKRLTTELATDNAAKMDMFARTAVTGAQNAGRVERMKETEEAGIKVKKKWLAAHDNRTRDTHADLDGQEVDADQKFKTMDGREIDYPGDPTADPDLVYNCRCTLIYVYPKYEPKEETHHFESYKEWKEKQEPKEEKKKEQKEAKEKKEDFDGGEEYLKQAYKEREEYRQEVETARQAWRNAGNEEDEIRRKLFRLDSNSPDYEQKFVELSAQRREKHELTEKAFEEYRNMQRNMPFNAADLDVTAKNCEIDYNIPLKTDKQSTAETIAAEVGGGDMTKGSCASLGFCYVGQQEGYDVLDFRDGASRSTFAQNCDGILRGIAKETGKPLLVEETKQGTGGAVKLLKQCEPGREYYFTCGRHASIVRVIETDSGSKFQYFELQSRYENGWKLGGYVDDRKSLDYTFKHRFGCSSGISGRALMMDVEDMKGSKLLHRVLGYINTAADKQVKGAIGHER